MRQTWQRAHRVAHIAAAHAHSDLGVSRDGWIDVVRAIGTAGIALMMKPVPRLFGVYISPASDGPGILINSSLPLPTLRHTAAHELGHHHLRHGDTADSHLDTWDPSAVTTWNTAEMSAEAFAAWFLMPPPAVRAASASLGVSRPSTAQEVYRMAAILGVSYRGLARHLVNLRLATEAQAGTWIRTSRKQLRRQLAGPAADRYGGDVHVLRPAMAGATVYVGVDDLLVIDTSVPAGDWGIEVPAGLEPVAIGDGQEPPLIPGPGGLLSCWRVSSAFTEPSTLRVSGGSHQTGWLVTVVPAFVREGIDLKWLEAR